MGMSNRNVSKSSSKDNQLTHTVAVDTPVNGAGAEAMASLASAVAVPAVGVSAEQAPWAGEADFQRLAVPSILEPTTKSTQVASLALRRPRKQEWVRVRPGPEHRGQYGLLVDEKSGHFYVVIPDLHGELAGEFGYYAVVTAVTRDGDTLLWPLRLSDGGGRVNTWWETALDAARRAEERWVRLQADVELGRYVVKEVEGGQEPQWPEKSFGELFAVAFKDRVIASLDHPVVKRLRGAP